MRAAPLRRGWLLESCRRRSANERELRRALAGYRSSDATALLAGGRSTNASTWSSYCSTRTSATPTKRAERRRYCQQHRVGERTIRGCLHRYRKKGLAGCCSTGRGPTSPRVHDPQLRAKLLSLINEPSTRSVLNCASCSPPSQLGPKIKRISDRSVYRFLASTAPCASASVLSQ